MILMMLFVDEDNQQKVGSTRETSLAGSDKTLQEVFAEQKKKQDLESRKRALATAKLQAETLLKYEKAGIKITVAERAKVIKEFEKKQQNENLKTLIEHQNKLFELQREHNKLILSEGSGATLKERLSAIGEETKANIAEKFSISNMLGSAIKMFDNLTKEFNGIMSEYAKYQIDINTRLQDTGKTFGSMSKMLKDNIGVTPFIKTQTMFENLNKLTELGIVYNLEQRAFLETIADNISTTFDATNSSLLRLIRLQQSDSTAARLGLETAITQYLNRMYQAVVI